MIYDYTPLGHDLFQVPIRHRVADVEEDCEQDHLLWKVRIFESDHLASSEWRSGRLEPSILQVIRVKKQSLQQNPDLVLPGGMSGIDLSIAARQLQPDLPVVTTKGYDPRGVLAEEPHRYFPVLRKPYTRTALATALLQELHRS